MSDDRLVKASREEEALGRQRVAAEKAIDAVLKRTPDAPFEQLVRDILRAMMRV